MVPTSAELNHACTPAGIASRSGDAIRLPELLAPAGDWDCIRAAVENGADAVYFGLDRFNARMRAKNFTVADLPSLMEFLHRRQVRGYITFNTLVFTPELSEAVDYLRVLVSAGVDAAIVQDIGIARLIRRLTPDFPIHCSTQMTITTAAGIDFARRLGASLVVLARENSLSDIAAIAQSMQADAPPQKMALEVFVHGALCVAYSGQCLTSESLGGRSANRGECAQACRLPYDLFCDGKKVDLGDRKYLLSPRDLSGIDLLPDLVKAGVASLKIEGRLKSAEYVASITRVYRNALDRLKASLAGESNQRCEGQPMLSGCPLVPASDRYELEMGFSRGLASGWFRGTDNQELVHARFGTKRGVFLGRVVRVDDDAVLADLEQPLKPGDGIVFDAGTPEAGEEGGRVYQVEPAGAKHHCLRFGRGDIAFERIHQGDRIWKTSDPALERTIRSTFEGDKPRYKRPLDWQVHGHANAPLILIGSDRAGHVARAESAIPLEPARDRPLDGERLRQQLGRLGGTPFDCGDIHSHLEGPLMLPVSELNRLRREVVAELERQRAKPRTWTLLDTSTEDALSSFASDPSATTALRAEASALVRDEAHHPAADQPELIALIRHEYQLEAAWKAGIRTIYCECENPKNYRDIVAHFCTLREKEPIGGNGRTETIATLWVAPPRIMKPGEDWILRQVRSCDADGYLVRNYDHLVHFRGCRLRGDYSLNVANPLAAEYLLGDCGLERVTASYDLNVAQMEALLASMPADRLDLTLHQHMPMFHMEHCVFCAFLSSGHDYRDCGRPCEKHRVELRDRIGALLPLKADAGCRNTVFNNRAQTGAEFLPRFLALGARHFRIEFVDESAFEVERTLLQYGRLLRGEISGADLWREFKLINQMGVTRGQLETAAQQLAKKT